MKELVDNIKSVLDEIVEQYEEQDSAIDLKTLQKLTTYTQIFTEKLNHRYNKGSITKMDIMRILSKGL